MRTVVDTNVVAYFLLGTQPFVDETRHFWRAVAEPIAPVLWEAELANVVWMAVRTGLVPAEEGSKRLDWAARLGIHSVPIRTLWQGALARSVGSGVAVYDTLFVELAGREHLRLATFDTKILSAFPTSPNVRGTFCPSSPKPPPASAHSPATATRSGHPSPRAGWRRTPAAAAP